jgi:hypothetical protein
MVKAFLRRSRGGGAVKLRSLTHDHTPNTKFDVLTFPDARS